jgi:hypothetical protein
MDVIKTQLDFACTDWKFHHGKCNFVGIEQVAESDVKTGSQFNAASWGDLTVAKDEVELIIAKEESVLGLKGEIQPTEGGCLLRVKNDNCIAAKQKDKRVVKNVVSLNTPQGKGPLQPGKEEVGIAITL